MSRALSQANGNSILVMGMTVVVRRVANQLSKSVTSIDINEDAIQLLTPAIDKKHNEKIIRANWLELPDVYGKKADVIAGDGVFCTMQSMSDSISLLKCLKNYSDREWSYRITSNDCPQNIYDKGHGLQ